MLASPFYEEGQVANCHHNIMDCVAAAWRGFWRNSIHQAVERKPRTSVQNMAEQISSSASERVPAAPGTADSPGCQPGDADRAKIIRREPKDSLQVVAPWRAGRLPFAVARLSDPDPSQQGRHYPCRQRSSGSPSSPSSRRARHRFFLAWTQTGSASLLRRGLRQSACTGRAARRTRSTTR